MTDYKLMPVEPTREMLDRAMRVVTGFSGECGRFNDYLDENTAREVYAAFTDNAPDVQGEPEMSVSEIIEAVANYVGSQKGGPFPPAVIKAAIIGQLEYGDEFTKLSSPTTIKDKKYD